MDLEQKQSEPRVHNITGEILNPQDRHTGVIRATVLPDAIVEPGDMVYWSSNMPKKVIGSITERRPAKGEWIGVHRDYIEFQLQIED